jgi:hypothetical protein
VLDHVLPPELQGLLDQPGLMEQTEHKASKGWLELLEQRE